MQKAWATGIDFRNLTTGMASLYSLIITNKY